MVFIICYNAYYFLLKLKYTNYYILLTILVTTYYDNQPNASNVYLKSWNYIFVT